MKSNLMIIAFLVLVSFTSCVTTKKIMYLQYKGSPDDTIRSVTPSAYTLQPFDNLFIRVMTPDPKFSDMFNTIPATLGSITLTEQSADMLSYVVDGDGAIELPYVGKFVVAGKTLSTVKAEFENALKAYIADAAITVKMVNNYVSLIGEMARPGRYPIYKDRMNIFQALAMGGDLGEYSNRQKIQLIRQTDGGNRIIEFSINNRSIMASEFFYVMPNDVIYAPPMKGKFFQLNSFPYSVILSSITTFVLLMNVLK